MLWHRQLQQSAAFRPQLEHASHHIPVLVQLAVLRVHAMVRRQAETEQYSEDPEIYPCFITY